MAACCPFPLEIAKFRQHVESPGWSMYDGQEGTCRYLCEMNSACAAFSWNAVPSDGACLHFGGTPSMYMTGNQHPGTTCHVKLPPASPPAQAAGASALPAPEMSPPIPQASPSPPTSPSPPSSPNPYLKDLGPRSFAQLVWRETRFVGCGQNTGCARGTTWVCHYRPIANMTGDEREKRNVPVRLPCSPDASPPPASLSAVGTGLPRDEGRGAFNTSSGWTNLLKAPFYVRPDTWTGLHNLFRRKHADVDEVQWDHHLQVSAQIAANRCPEHDEPQLRLRHVGENLAWGQETANEVVEDWYATIKDYRPFWYPRGMPTGDGCEAD